MRLLTVTLLGAALALSACGTDHVNTATYTCADFKKSLDTKNDNSSGTFINDLRDQAKLGQAEKVERREITLGIIIACRGKSGSTTPGKQAIATAKRIKAGKFKAAAPAKTQKTSGN
jgi:hypothetical protein